jgi:hypothetical protein
MDETIIDKIFKINTENYMEYECLFTCEEINSIKNTIDILKIKNNNLINELEITIKLIDDIKDENTKLKDENLDLKTNNLKLEKSNNLIEGVLLIPSNKLELKIELNEHINNISFYIELRLIKEHNITNYLPLFSIISIDKKSFISLGWYNNKIRIDDNLGCSYYSKNECILEKEWSSIFGIIQISSIGMNIILELNKKKILFSRFEKTKNSVDSIINNKNCNLIIGYSPKLINNEIENIMFRKLVVIKDKLSFEEITNINYEQTKNSIYIDFTS